MFCLQCTFLLWLEAQTCRVKAVLACICTWVRVDYLSIAKYCLIMYWAICSVHRNTIFANPYQYCFTTVTRRISCSRVTSEDTSSLHRLLLGPGELAASAHLSENNAYLQANKNSALVVVALLFSILSVLFWLLSFISPHTRCAATWQTVQRWLCKWQGGVICSLPSISVTALWSLGELGGYMDRGGVKYIKKKPTRLLHCHAFGLPLSHSHA